MVFDNLEYAFLDNALWDILQDYSTLEMYGNAILEYYFKK
jgi:hypothetical protein